VIVEAPTTVNHVVDIDALRDLRRILMARTSYNVYFEIQEELTLVRIVAGGDNQPHRMDLLISLLESKVHPTLDPAGNPRPPA
jgi:hypothetical protein